jgi:hypothetical protein
MLRAILLAGACAAAAAAAAPQKMKKPITVPVPADGQPPEVASDAPLLFLAEKVCRTISTWHGPSPSLLSRPDLPGARRCTWRTA